MNTLFKITHSSNFNTSVQAMMLIEQLSTTNQITVDRFYRTLYESLLDPRLTTSSKHALYLNLLYRALKSDLNLARVKAFTKRLLQILTLHQPPFICGALYMVKQLEEANPGLKTLYNYPESTFHVDEEVFRDVDKSSPDYTSIDGNVHQETNRSHYDGRKRDPSHSNAEKSCLWEIVSFLRSVLGECN
jgi:ribosome biogenesis protein MAK21